MHAPPQVVGSDQPGLFAPSGLGAEAPPAAFRPLTDASRPTAYPTPLCRAEATRFLLKNDAFDSDLAAASVRLMRALVAGQVSLRWVSTARLRGQWLRAALDEFLVDGRVGLLATGNTVVGYILDDGVPVLSGAIEGLKALNHLLPTGTEHHGAIRFLLEQLRQPYQRDQQWDPVRIAWMALVEHIIANTGAVTSVDLATDVAALGPFHLPVPRSPGAVVAAKPPPRYLLRRAPQFVHRLARALTADLVDPRTGTNTTASWRLQFRGEVLAEFAPSGAGAAAVASFVKDVIPEECRDIQRLDTSDALTRVFAQHLKVAQDQHGQLTRLLAEDPCALSDIARVVTRYSPGIIGERTAHNYSGSFASWSETTQHDAYVSTQQLEALVAAGRAFVLPGNGDAADCILFEDAPREGVASRHAIGDLSNLGLALWLVFDGAAYAEVGDSTRRNGMYFDDTGDPLIDTGGAGFPLVFPQTVVGRWAGMGLGAVADRAATLQRFARSYADRAALRDAAPADRLCSVAVASFIGRLGEVVNQPLAHVVEPDAGATAVDGGGERPLDLGPHGGLVVLRDPLRDDAAAGAGRGGR